VLITAAGQEPPAADLDKLEAFRQSFESFYRTATSNRAEAEASLRRAVQLSLWPASGVVAGSAARASLTLDEPGCASLHPHHPGRFSHCQFRMESGRAGRG